MHHPGQIGPGTSSHKGSDEHALGRGDAGEKSGKEAQADDLAGGGHRHRLGPLFKALGSWTLVSRTTASVSDGPSLNLKL